MTKTQTQIINWFGDTDFFDSNCPLRRFFRVYIEGGYLGQEHFIENRDYVYKAYFNKSDHAKRVQLRSFIINQFLAYLAHDCTDGKDNSFSRDAYVKALKEMLADKIEIFNNALVNDALETLIPDEINNDN